jgi:large conductance mechanosensitive channel
MLKEFRAFAMRGNVVDLAVGLILGAAFGAIVTSLVNDLIMPPIGFAMGGVNFTDLFISLDGQTYPSLTAAKAAGAPVIAYGAFINTVINFLVIAFAVFLLVKQMNRLVKQDEAAPTPPTDEVVLLTEIRDLLRARPEA